MKYTRLIFAATLINTLGFFTALSINNPGQPALELTLTNIATVLFGVVSIIGWLWVLAKVENTDMHKPYGDKVCHAPSVYRDR